VPHRRYRLGGSAIANFGDRIPVRHTVHLPLVMRGWAGKVAFHSCNSPRGMFAPSRLRAMGNE